MDIIQLKARGKMLLKTSIALIVYGLVALEMSPGSAPSAGTNGVTEPVPPSYFSMNILFHPLNHVPWPVIPLGGWRTSHVNWADIQLEKGSWKFDLLDKYVHWSQDHHTPILMPLTYTPRWASSNPDAPTDVEVGNPPGLSGPPRDMEDWRVFVRTVAIRYKGSIHDWEIWNEPNRSQSWTGSVDAMVDMTREASKILKEIDPNNRIVSPAPTGVNGLPFLDKFLSKGGGQYVDVIGYHFYVGQQEPPEAMVPLIQKVRNSMQRYGLADKPLWNTEAGWLGPVTFSPDVQAAYISRAFILNWAYGVNRFYWYAWESHHGSEIELTGSDNAALTPAGKAFGTTQAWMTGAILSQCSNSSDGTWVCELRRQGKISHIVWNTRGDTRSSIPAGWQAKYVDSLAGTRTELTGPSIAVGIQPVLIQ
jgi:putative glycosyl hydrolase